VDTRQKSVCKNKKANECLSFLHDKYVGVSPNKASNNIVFVCDNYYYGCLIKEQLGIFKHLVMLLSFQYPHLIDATK
jgi:hypothetical protein